MNFASTIAFINPKSGGKHGSKVYVKLCLLLGKDHVFDLTQGGPEPGLRQYRRHENLRVIACGGDGTVGWVHSCIDRIKFLSPPAVVPFPLGTGNDMSRVLGWGANYAGESVAPILEAIEEGIPIEMDRWMISSDPLEEEDLIELQSLICACDKSFSDDYECFSSQEMETFSTTSSETSQSGSEVPATSKRRASVPVVSNTLLTSDGAESSSQGPVSPQATGATQKNTRTTAPQSGNSVPQKVPSAPLPSWLSQRKLRFHSTSEIPVRSTTYSDDCEVITLGEKRKRDKNRDRSTNGSQSARTASQSDELLRSTSPSPGESLVIEISPKKSKRKANKKGFSFNSSSTTLPSPRDSALDDTMSTATLQSDPPSELDIPTPKTKKRSKKKISTSSSDPPSSPSPTPIRATFTEGSTHLELSSSLMEGASESSPSRIAETESGIPMLDDIKGVVSVDIDSQIRTVNVLVAVRPEEKTLSSLDSFKTASLAVSETSISGVGEIKGVQDGRNSPEVETAPIFKITAAGDSELPPLAPSRNKLKIGSNGRKLAASDEQKKPRKQKSKKTMPILSLTSSPDYEPAEAEDLTASTNDGDETLTDHSWRTKSGPLPERSRVESPPVVLEENVMKAVQSPALVSPNVKVNRSGGEKDESGISALDVDRSSSPSEIVDGQDSGSVCEDNKLVSSRRKAKKTETLGEEAPSLLTSISAPLPPTSADLSLPRASLSGTVSLKRIPDLEMVAPTSSINSSSKRSAERKTLVMNNYFSVGVDSMVALEFHNKREAMPSLFPHHVINKAWYGIYGIKHAMLNSISSKSKTADLRRVMKLALDDKWVEIPKGVEAIVFLQIQSYSSGTNVWGDASKTKGQKRAPTVSDGLFEVVGMKGVMHLGALQAGWSSGIRLGQARSATLYNLAVVPVQCDGEPWLLPPCKTTIAFHNRSTMLFNIASGARRFRAVTGLAPPSFALNEKDEVQPVPADPEASSALSPPSSSSSASTVAVTTPLASSSQAIPPLQQVGTMLSAQELRSHIRGSSSLARAAFQDVPPRIRASRQSISNPDLNPKAALSSSSRS